MDHARIALSKWADSADYWVRSVDAGDVNRQFLLDGVMLDSCADVRGLTVLDVGCGEGRFTRMLAARGAQVFGVDATGPLTAVARQRDPSGAYARCLAERLPFASESFDLAVSYVVLTDVEDLEGAALEMARILKPGGRAVVANLTALATSAGAWHRNSEGVKIHWPVDRYFEARRQLTEWAGISVINWHRPMQQSLGAFLAAGLRLVKYLEPQPDDAAIRLHPAMADETRIPRFDVCVWEKS